MTRTRFGELVLHDQKDDSVDTRYSVQSETGGILFLFNECGLTAREVFETFVLGCDFTLKTAARGETPDDEIARLRAVLAEYAKSDIYGARAREALTAAKVPQP